MQSSHGFSLLEVLIATGFTVGVGAVILQLLQQNERTFRDQTVMFEMQQTARMALSQVAEDIRKAGQSIPLEAGAVLMPGTGTSRLNLRGSFSGTETWVTSPLPLTAAVGESLTVDVESVAGFSAGRQAFLWNDEGWVRALVDSVSASSQTVRITPSAVNVSPAQFTTPPTLSTDEAVAVYWDPASSAVRRTTATNTENPKNPNWAPANELAANVIGMTVSYYDDSGNALTSDIVAEQSNVAWIELRLTVRSSLPLSNGTRPTYSLSTRCVPRNLHIRNFGR